ncbi:hypothetical protein WG909_02120 [Peptostreptococcaceae bacterium AGR-M142]
MNSRVMVGAWTKFRTNLSDSDKKVFSRAMDGIMGVNYEPIAVATEVVEGTNYRFFCNSQIVRPDAPNEASMIEIWEKPNGEIQPPRITNIRM